jgi:Fic family protein
MVLPHLLHKLAATNRPQCVARAPGAPFSSTDSVRIRRRRMLIHLTESSRIFYRTGSDARSRPLPGQHIEMTTKTIKKKTAVTPGKEPAKRVRTIEERTKLLDEGLRAMPEAFQANYRAKLDMSWIYHDSALEGTVYTEQELTTGLDPDGAPRALEAGIQVAYGEIVRHRAALDFIRAEAIKDKKSDVTVEFIRELYFLLHPEEGDAKSVRYRKDIPQHRLYFHEYAAPDKIAAKVKTVAESVNDDDALRSKGALRHATRMHYDLLRVFPFPHDSGKVARLLLNFLLLRAGYPPAIIHMSERQRYYEALRGSATTMNQIVHDSIENNLQSVEKLLASFPR